MGSQALIGRCYHGRYGAPGYWQQPLRR